jgi:arylsulfatase A-like enzyme
MDTVRADHTSLGGYERNTTPHLAELAGSSTTFLNAYAASDWTLPSHASLFTSYYPGAHGAYCDGNFSRMPPLPDRFDTMAEYLRRAGYTTMAVTANQSGIQRDFGIHQGFQYFSCRNPTGFWNRPNRYHLSHAVWSALKWAFPKAEPKDLYRRADDINGEVLELLDQHLPRQAPFFLFVNYMDAHDPYEPRAPYDMKYPGKDRRFGRQWYLDMKNEVLRLQRTVTDAERRHMESQYDGGISLIDASIAAVLARLKERRALDNTLIVVTSDHGEAFGERHHVGHANSIYNDVIRVPLLIKYPRSTGRVVSSEPVSLVDVLPTVLDVLGIQGKRPFHGRSLRSSSGTLRGKVFAESYSCTGVHPRLQRTLRSVISHPLKLIQSSRGSAELYDIAGDPGETRDLAGPRSVVLAALLRNLQDWVSANAPLAKAMPAQLDEKALERLKTLGYVQ